MRFGSVEGALEHAAEVERKMYRESLQNHREQILLSKQLASIHCDVPVPLDLEALAVRDPDPEALPELYHTMEFHSPSRESLWPRGHPRNAMTRGVLEPWISAYSPKFGRRAGRDHRRRTHVTGTRSDPADGTTSGR